MAQLLKADSRLSGGLPLAAAVNSYVNWDDWAHHGKPADQAIANAAASTAGGWAGAALGAGTGAAACSFTGPIGAAFCAGVGAAIGGLAGGSGGGYVADHTVH